MSDLAKKAGLIVVSKAIGALSRVAAIVLLARVLSREEFGLVAFVLLTYLTVSSLSQLGLSESVFYFFEKTARGARRSLVLHLAKLLFVIAWGSALVLLLIAWIADSRGYAAIPLFQAMMLLVLIELPTLPIQNVMIAHEETRMAAWVNILFGIALFLGLSLPAMLGMSVEWIAYGLVVYGVFRLTVSAFLVFTRIPPATEPLPAGISRELFSYSVPLGLASIVSKLNQFIDKYVVMFFLPVAVFAEYTVGSWEVPFVPMIASSVASVMMTSFVSHHFAKRNAELLDLWRRAVKKVSIIVLPLMMLLVTVANELIVLLFTEKYQNAVVIFYIYTLVLFHRVADYGAILRSINQTGSVLRWNSLVLVTNCLLSVPCVWLLGAPGAALSTLVAVIIGWFYVLARIGDGLGTRLRLVFPFAFYARTLLVAVASGAPALLLVPSLDVGVAAALGLKIMIYLLTYLPLSVVTGVSSISDWRDIAFALKPPPARS